VVVVGVLRIVDGLRQREHAGRDDHEIGIFLAPLQVGERRLRLHRVLEHAHLGATCLRDILVIADGALLDLRGLELLVVDVDVGGRLGAEQRAQAVAREPLQPLRLQDARVQLGAHRAHAQLVGHADVARPLLEILLQLLLSLVD
jgi:hypothetical protein